MKCCMDCFADQYLRGRISATGTVGDCEFCGARNIASVDARDLRDLFTPVFSLFESVHDPDEEGEWLWKLIEERFSIFSQSLLLKGKQGALVDDVLDGNTDYEYRELWRPSYRDMSQWWDDFVNYIKHSRRYILNPLDLEEIDDIHDPKTWLPALLRELTCKVKQNYTFYRARLGGVPKRNHRGLNPWSPSKITAPPPQLARAGRANAVGIQVFYGATDVETAIAEVRPWKDATVSIARCRLLEEINVADLCKEFQPINNPLESGDLLGWELEKRAILSRLAIELSKPITPDAAEIDYVPTQYLSEVVKAAGYAGIIYPSAMGKGRNIAIFDPNKVKIGKRKVYRVEDIKYLTTFML